MDPSKQSPLCQAGSHFVGKHVQSALCFYNPSALFYGGCRFIGANVKERRINAYHLSVPYNRALLDEAYAFVVQQINKQSVA
jgi:hypothetical protein